MLSKEEIKYYENIIKNLREARLELKEANDLADKREENEAIFQELVWDFESIIKKILDNSGLEELERIVNKDLLDNDDLFDILGKLEELIYDAKTLDMPEVEFYKEEYKRLEKLVETTNDEIHEIIYDMKEYEKDPYGYYGVSIHDFI